MSDWSRQSWRYLLCATEVLFSVTWWQKISAQVMVRRQITRSICRIDPVVGNGLHMSRSRLASALQNKQNDLCAKRRLRSTRASAQSDQSSQCAQWLAEDPMFLHTDSEDWSDWADVQADLCLRWAQRSFCWFGRTAGAPYKSEPCSKKVLNSVSSQCARSKWSLARKTEVDPKIFKW